MKKIELLSRLKTFKRKFLLFINPSESLLGMMILLLFILEPLHAQSPVENLERYIQETMKDWRVPGLAVAIVKDDSLFYAKGFGVRELRKKAPVTTETLFPIGSMGKAFTVATIGLLVDEGKVDWNDAVVKHMPELVLDDPWVNRYLTLRDLLSHRTGYTEEVDHRSIGERSEFLERIKYIETDGSFRKDYRYTSMSFVVAGEVAARVTGKPWEELLDEQVFTPLRMKNSRAFPSQLSPHSNVAIPHVYLESGVRPIARESGYIMAAAGGIESNVIEMSHWLRMLLNQGTFEEDTFLSASVVGEIFEPQIIAPVDNRMNPYTKFSTYGLGWGISDYRGRKMISHGGQVAGATAHIRMIPEERFGVVVLTNSMNFTYPYAITYRAIDEWMEYQETDWSAMYKQEFDDNLKRLFIGMREMEEGRIEGTKPSQQLQSYVGTYAHPYTGEVHIAMEGDHLRVNYGDHSGHSGEMEHWHYDTFRVNRDYVVFSKYDWLTFNLNERGQVVSLDYQDTTFTRGE